MRFLSANYIFPISSAPIDNGILVVDGNGVVQDLLLPDDPNVPESSQIEVFDGILCPGFINAHCHLELSHMKNVVSEKTGLPKFVMEIVSRRNENADEKFQKIQEADAEMWANGIQAVGDICNTEDTLQTKRKSSIKYHSFVEVFSFNSSRADEVLAEGIRVAELYERAGLSATIVPHAPYSVSKQLFSGINAQQDVYPGPMSMHNQETPSENEMFVSAKGDLVELFKKFGEDFSDFHPDFRSSLDYSFNQLPVGQNSMLVHNTLTTSEEIRWVNSLRDDVYFCSCPSANMYIEDQLPNIPKWIENEAKICVGTDSLASNRQLSILEELKLIENHYPEIEVETLLKMATITGAKALQLETALGSFEKEKAPGVVLIQNTDIQHQKLGKNAIVKRIM